MTTTMRTPSATRANLRFAGHYLEMVVAMLVGMFALGPLWSFAVPGLLESVAVEAMVMAIDMTVAMALWMLVRRHSPRMIAEMSVAMVAPFGLALVPYWLGAISGHTVMMAGHVLMFPAMLAAMLLRHRAYRH